MLGVQVKGKFAGEIERYLSTLTLIPKSEIQNPKPKPETPKRETPTRNPESEI